MAACSSALPRYRYGAAKGRLVSGSAWLLLSFFTFLKVELNKVMVVALVRCMRAHLVIIPVWLELISICFARICLPLSHLLTI